LSIQSLGVLEALRAISLQLAHQERDDVSAAHNHALYLKARAEMMQAWANHLDELRRRHEERMQPGASMSTEVAGSTLRIFTGWPACAGAGRALPFRAGTCRILCPAEEGSCEPNAMLPGEVASNKIEASRVDLPATSIHMARWLI